MRSQAARQAHQATSQALADSIALCRLSGLDLIIAETAGIGQSDSAITELVDYSVYVMTPEYGAASQLEKIDMLDFAGAVVLNKYEKRGAEDALREVPNRSSAIAVSSMTTRLRCPSFLASLVSFTI